MRERVRGASREMLLLLFPPARASRGCGRICMRLATTLASERVDVSPRCSTSPAATLRRMRRMILPLRVLGNAGAQCTTSGAAKGPICVRTSLHHAQEHQQRACSRRRSISNVRAACMMPCPACCVAYSCCVLVRVCRAVWPWRPQRATRCSGSVGQLAIQVGILSD
jgi:hypothetical protein